MEEQSAVDNMFSEVSSCLYLMLMIASACGATHTSGNRHILQTGSGSDSDIGSSTPVLVDGKCETAAECGGVERGECVEGQCKCHDSLKGLSCALCATGRAGVDCPVN